MLIFFKPLDLYSYNKKLVMQQYFATVLRGCFRRCMEGWAFSLIQDAGSLAVCPGSVPMSHILLMHTLEGNG